MSSPPISDSKYDAEKGVAVHRVKTASENPISDGEPEAGDDDFEVFKSHAEVNYRTVGWQKATLIFFKIQFGTGVLSIPSAFIIMGAVPGCLSIILWGIMNTYFSWILGDFRNTHKGVFSIVDMARIVGGPVLAEIVNFLFVTAWTLVTGSGIVGVATALNSFTKNGACTVWFSFVGAVLVTGFAAIPRLERLGTVAYFGMVSIFVAVLTVVIASAVRDRPAAAPQTGPYDLGYINFGSPTFAQGMVATATIFGSSTGGIAFINVISEMRNPLDYNKALYGSAILTHGSYLTFSMVLFWYVGQYITSPSLGSAGHVIQNASYGVGFLGLIVSASIWLHTAAKVCFVRILRDSEHLQKKSVIHHLWWYGIVLVLGTIAFIVSQAIPIFGYIIALAGALCYGPTAAVLPVYIYLWSNWAAVKKGGLKIYLAYGINIIFFFSMWLVTVGGTYAVVLEIKDAYAAGTIGSAFSCADNSGST